MDSYLIISAMRGSAGGAFPDELFQEGSRCEIVTIDDE
jgi:hypothetical protein